MTLADSDSQRQYVTSSQSLSPPTSPYLSQPFTDLLDQQLYATNYTFPPPLDLSYSDPPSDEYYIDSRQSTPLNHFQFPHPQHQLMTDNLPPNPAFFEHSTTPTFSLANTPPPMSEGGYYAHPASSNSFQEVSYLSPQTPQQQYNLRRFQTHKRVSSSSSIGSAGPDSPYTQSSVFPHIVDTDTQSMTSPHLETFDLPYSNSVQYPKPLPAPLTGLNHGSLYNQNQNFQNFNISANNAASMMSAHTRQATTEQRRQSTMNGEQHTSRRSFGGEYDGSSDMRSVIPTLDRTVSDACQDELYNPHIASSTPSSQQTQQYASQASQGNLLSPYRAMFNERLQAANTARSASPTTDLRERSPFRESLGFAVQQYSHSHPSSPATRLNSAAHIREQQKMESDARAYAQHHPPARHEYVTPNTISPKEALLERSEQEVDVKMFPDIKSEPDFPVNGLSRSVDENGSRLQSSPKFSSSQQSSSEFNFMHPSVPDVPQQYPFIAQSRRQSSSMRSTSDQLPEFPASLTSMESTRSESGQLENIRPPTFRSENSAFVSPSSPLTRPTDTAANSGTYTCTAPTCTARFETSQKLQKHRREHNRSSSSTTPTTPSLSNHNSLTAANNVSRNNQPGPHKCEKINPGTGKPCNTIFSRSYDLTRHEDTIHNGRKQKVRCGLCTEEKTFSRNDALTRHMRVVHPTVEFSGKAKRRGG